MSSDSGTDGRYTTGDVAKLTSVSVRTVQYYDTKGLLAPSEISDGGRRLYSPDDIERMRVILFLKDLGFKLEQIRSMLADEHPEQVIADLLDQQTTALKADIDRQKRRLDDCLRLRQALADPVSFPISLPDMATMMNTNITHQPRTTHLIMLAIALPATILQIAGLAVGIMTGVWWPLLAAVIVAIALAVGSVAYYHSRVQYLCPSCHTTFRPGMREFMFASHTPKTRKLSCPQCGRVGHCMELGV